MKAVLPLALLALAACADWPDTGAPSPSQRSYAWPELLPVSDIMAEDEGRISQDTAASLAARAAALRARAALLRRDLETQAEMDALRARLAR